jgi:hypothetical protein
MHAVDPVQRLRLLRAAQWGRSGGSTARCRASCTRFATSTPTICCRAVPGQVAFLPFLVERCHDADGDEHYLVSRLVTGFSAPGFVPGAEVTHWGGIPMSRAVALNGERSAGSTEAATLARGLEPLTIRPHRIHVPPDDDWVIVAYLDQSGTERELREHWRVTKNLPMMADLDRPSTCSTRWRRCHRRRRAGLPWSGGGPRPAAPRTPRSPNPRRGTPAAGPPRPSRSPASPSPPPARLRVPRG